MKQLNVSYLLIILLYLAAISCCNIAHATTYNMEVLNAVYPPASEEQKCITIDKNGLIWIGSDNGVKSYDGYHFQTYRNGANTPNTLPNNTVISLAEGYDNQIWIGTKNGLAKLNQKSGKFTHINLASKQVSKTVYPLFTARNGDIWIGIEQKLYKYSAKDQKFQAYNNRNTIIQTYDGKKIPMPNLDIQSFAEDAKGRIYVGTWGHGIYQFDSKKRILHKYHSWNDATPAHALKFDRKGRLWVGTWGAGISCLTRPWNIKEPGCLNFKTNSQEFTIIYRIIEDPISNTIWACSRDGIGIINENNISAGFTYCKEIGTYKKYNIQSTMDLATDGKGNIWALTLNKGLVHINTQPSIFNFQTIPTQNLTINSINAISTIDGKHIWMSMAPAGIAYYDLTTNSIKYNYQIPSLAGLPKNPIETHVNAIMQLNEHEIWFASQGYGIIIVKNGKGKHMTPNNCSFIKTGTVNALMQSQQGTIFIGEYRYLNYILPSKKVVNLKIDANITAISEDHQHRIWLSTEDQGIIQIKGNLQNPKFVHYKHYNSINKKLPINDIVNCIEDSSHRIWAISKSGGLFKYNKEKDTFINISNQLLGGIDRILSIMQDNQGDIWLTTDDALIKLKITGNDQIHYAIYSREDGLGDILFQPKSCFRMNSTLFWGSGKNLIVYNTSKENSQLLANSYSNIMVTDLLVNGKSFHDLDSTQQAQISHVAPPYMKSFTLPASINKFSIELALLSYRNVEKCKYAYFLKGYDKEWHKINANIRQVTFENLPTGTYSLQIKAADSYGQWSNLPYDIMIKILPPWYASWWAKLMYIGCILLIIYAAILGYRSRIRTQNQLQMAVIFTNITHELLTPLSVISAAADAIKLGYPSSYPQTDIIHGNIARLTRMLRQILEVRKAQSSKLKLRVSQEDIGGFCQEVYSNLLPMFNQKNIAFDINITCHGIMTWFDTDKLEKILYNLLSNAVKYSNPHGKVSLYAGISNGHLCIRIADTGIGMSAVKMKHLYDRFLDGDYRKMKTLGTGIGLSLVHDLVKLHHGKIDCKSEEGKGTIFTIYLPINKESYSDEEIIFSSQKSKHEEALSAISGNFTELTQEKSLLLNEQEQTNLPEYTVLLVEDNTELLHLMRNLLNTHYQVKTANNGERAKDMIEKYPLDIVVTDVMMPVMDGIALTQWIKNSKDYSQLPVIMLTAKTQNEDRNEAYRVGADDYITKPFNLQDLQLRINNIICNRERIRIKFQQQTDFKVEDQHYSSPDEIFLQTVIDKVLENIKNCDYGREELAADLCISSSTLYNKLRALTGMNITSFINSIRMKEACKILKRQPSIRINELYYLVGYNTPRYFSQCFKKEYGITVKEYIEKECR